MPFGNGSFSAFFDANAKPALTALASRQSRRPQRQVAAAAYAIDRHVAGWAGQATRGRFYVPIVRQRVALAIVLSYGFTKASLGWWRSRCLSCLFFIKQK